ncbi:MAG: CHASE domain-containing protein, partial [SAR324 cluster bacterium]|nr:CHASE domain-containing protein [SAR324 cluster bacterium]
MTTADNHTAEQVDSKQDFGLKWIGMILSLSLIYLFAARLSLLLASPPGFASPIWPAAGIALVFLLRFGIKTWPGVILGSFFANLWASLPSDITAFPDQIFYLSLIISMGAALQALLGVILIKKWIHFPYLLETQKDVLLFILIGAPLTCLVSASFGVMGLLLTGVIPIGQALMSWGVWWTGNTLGVLVFAPLSLTVFFSSSPLWVKRRFSVAIPILITFLFVLSFFYSAKNWEIEKQRLEFHQRSEAISQVLGKRITRSLDTLEHIRSLYYATGSMNGKLFRDFVNASIRLNKDIQALSWNPWINNQHRQEYEDSMHREGYPDFIIKERDNKDNVIPSPKQDFYVPVGYIEPFESNRKAHGFNVASNPSRLTALSGALKQNHAQGTDPITLVQGDKKLNGILIFLPVYHPHKPTETFKDRQESVTGFAVGVYELDRMLESAINEQPAKGLDFYLVKVSSEKPTLIFAQSHIPTTEITQDFLNNLLQLGQTSDISVSDISFAGHHWKLAVHRSDELAEANQSWQLWLVLVGGVLFTGILGVFFLILSGNSSILESSIARRIDAEDALAKTNESLEMRIVERTSELVELNRKLIISDQAKTSFLRTMSHELRTPLTVIMGNITELVDEDDLPPPEEVADIAQDCEKAGAHLMSLINDVLDISKIEAGKME